jgi:drug/metabolite transporter (DMT)-like permease
VFVQKQGSQDSKTTMGILFGLTAAICWGVADFVVTRIARELGVAQAFFTSRSAVILAGVLLVSL